MSNHQGGPAAVFGLTGSIGAGKSTVGHQLAAYGATIIDADDIVNDLSQPGGPAHEAIVTILGHHVVTLHGRLDRQKVAEMIFADQRLRREIEQAVHPLVCDAMWAQVKQINKKSIIVFEVPLLKRGDTVNMQGVILVTATPELSLQRLARRGLTPEQATARLKAQTSPEALMSLADFTITNTGSQADLRDQTVQAWQWMQRRINHPTHDD